MADSAPDDGRDGRSTRWDEHRENRRATIIEAAIAAIEEYGPDALTGQIAERAGVPRTHVYRHFDGKQALDLAVSARIGRQMAEEIRAGLATGGSARQIISAAIDHHLGWIEAHPSLYRFLAQHAYAVRATGSHEADDAKAVFAHELTAVFGGYLTALGVDGAPVERVVVGFVGLVDTTAAWWLEHRDPPREVLTRELTEQVWLLVDRSARGYGLTLDPDQPLPRLTPDPLPSPLPPDPRLPP
jgi:AcrR family transcriptional regulator